MFERSWLENQLRFLHPTRCRVLSMEAAPLLGYPKLPNSRSENVRVSGRNYGAFKAQGSELFDERIRVVWV